MVDLNNSFLLTLSNILNAIKAFGTAINPVYIAPGPQVATSRLLDNHISAGGTVQFATLTFGAPPNGYELNNSDPTTYMFLSETTSGWTNGPTIPNTTQNGPGVDGWIVVPPMGSYLTPAWYQPNPLRGVAIYSPLTGHRFCWRSG